MSNKPLIPYTVDELFEASHLGSIKKALGLNLRGIDFMKTGAVLAPNKTSYGYVFFTRPQLNLQTDNIRTYRKFFNLLSKDESSIHRYIRATLDPRIMYPYSYTNNRYSSEGLNCPYVDREMAFIPAMTNNLKSITGWPDSNLPIFTSKPGLYKEVYAQPDGQIRNYGSFNVTANFRNVLGSPILYLSYIWTHYMTLVHEGIMMPYLDMLTENERDYDTRIYRITTDQTRRYIREISATGVSFPTTSPTSNLFDYNTDKPHNDTNNEFGVTFECLGMDYFDDITVYEFNKTSMAFCKGLRPENIASRMTEINPAIGVLFNYRAYPLIDTSSKVNELKWYTDTAYYEDRLRYFGPILGYNPMLKKNDIVSYDVESVLNAIRAQGN